MSQASGWPKFACQSVSPVSRVQPSLYICHTVVTLAATKNYRVRLEISQKVVSIIHVPTTITAYFNVSTYELDRSLVRLQARRVATSSIVPGNGVAQRPLKFMLHS